MAMSDRSLRPLSLMPAAMIHGNVIAELHARCFDEAWSPFTVRQVLGLPGSFGFIATLASSAVPGGPEIAPGTPDFAGFVLARAAAQECEVLSLAVGEAWRAAGVGRMLMERAIDEARARRAVSVFLEVAEDNAIAQRLYRSLGFRAVGRRRDYYRRRNGPAAAALTYSLSLDLAT